MNIFKRFNLKQHKWIAELVICLTITGMITVLYLANVGEPFELKTIDLRFKLRGPRAPNEKIGIIVMDDDSVQALGRWPWPRDYHSILVHVLDQFKPTAICFDVLFTERDEANPEGDLKLARSSRKSGVTYFPFYFMLKSGEKSDFDLLKRKVEVHKKLKGITILHKTETHEDFFQAVLMTPPIALLADTIKGSGFVNANPDVDGTTRRLPLVIEYKGELYPSFAFRIACDYLGVDRQDIGIKLGRYIEIKKADNELIRIPIDKKGQMLIDFDGGLKVFRWFSYASVITSFGEYREGRKPEIDLEQFKDMILFIGLTATGTVDIRPTPFEASYPLVGVLANTASNIINGNFIRESGTTVNLFTLWILGLLIGLISHRLKPLVGAAFSILMVALYFGFAFYLFVTQGLCVLVMYPSAVILFGYLSIVVFKFATEEKEKKWIKNVFQRYVSSSVVDEMLSDVDKLSLGGSKKELTIFFADVRGFTSMSEKMKPEDVVAILNRIFTMITEILFRYEGTLDKFMGDCIMAIWGAPIALRNPEELALRTAMEMQEKMKVIQEDLVREGMPPVGFGIGINTGEVIVGNMGSLQHMDYTVIGDEVNLTSRIEGCAKSGQILITASMLERVKDLVEVNELEPVKVKGKTNAIPVYEVLRFK